ncbi:MAG: addiction module antidote protein [Bacteroidota bacterium]
MITTEFDISDYLDSKEMIAEYLNTVLEEGDSSDLAVAIGHVAKAIGMTKIAEETGMSRSSLYKALSEGSRPQFDTVTKVLKAIGGQLSIKPA